MQRKKWDKNGKGDKPRERESKEEREEKETRRIRKAVQDPDQSTSSPLVPIC